MIHTHTFPKAEKVWGKKNVDELFAKGRWSSAGDLKYCWVIPSAGGEPAGTPTPRVMVSVPKKFFRRAVKRNLLKRRIREAYRLQKSLLDGAGVDIMFVYNSKDILAFEEIFETVGRILESVGAKLEQTHQDN